MRDDTVSARAMVASFVGVIVFLVFVVNYVMSREHTSQPPLASAPASHVTRAPPHVTTAARRPTTTTWVPAPAVNWSPTILAVTTLDSDTARLLTLVNDPTPSVAGFQADCTAVEGQVFPPQPAGVAPAIAARVQDLIIDDVALKSSCQKTIADAVVTSDPTAVADGEAIGHAIVSLRSDSTIFFSEIGYAGKT